jgi:hypothetical protein
MKTILMASLICLAGCAGRVEKEVENVAKAISETERAALEVQADYKALVARRPDCAVDTITERLAGVASDLARRKVEVERIGTLAKSELDAQKSNTRVWQVLFLLAALVAFMLGRRRD